MMYRYLIWDFDGTLFDTYPPVVAALCAVLAEANVAVRPARVARLMRHSMSRCVNTLAAEHNLDPDALTAQLEAVNRDIPAEAQPPFEGAARVCRRVIAAGGSNYIVTHRKRASLRRLLAHHGMLRLFADCITADDGYPRKPDPASFLAMMARHNLPPHETLAIGDRLLDIEAGRAAGLHTCLFSTAPLEGVTPDHVVGSYAELEAILFPAGAGE